MEGAERFLAEGKVRIEKLRRDELSQTHLPKFEFLLDLAEGASGGVGLAVFQEDEVLAFEHGLQFVNLVEVDDDGAADTEELLRREMGFEEGHGFAEDVVFLRPVRRTPDVHDGVFAGGFDGMDVVQFYERDFAGSFDGQASELTGR